MSAWPTDDLTNANLDGPIDDPSLARAELNALLLKVQAMLAAAGTAADEVLKLDGNANAGLTVGTAQRTLAKTADYTVVVADLGRTILVDATSGNVTISLPAAATAGNGFPVIIKKINSSVNTVTVDGNGAETIDGATTVVLRARYESVAIVCDATSWSVVGQPPISGLWTPTVQDSSFSDAKGQTYVEQNGVYTKIGNMVFVSADILINSLGTLVISDTCHVAKLPFTSVSSSGHVGSVSVDYGTSLNIAAGQMISGIIMGSSTRIQMKLWDGAAGPTNLLISELSTGALLTFRGHYMVP